MTQARPSRPSSLPGGIAPQGDAPGKPRISAIVGLSLLEVIRARDLPTEVLAAEDPSRTMPRRLGLSEAVELQIRRFREEVRRKGRMSDDQARDLFRLVLRRPDAEEVFFQAGELLVGKDTGSRGIGRFYPRRALFAMARRQTRRRLRALLGREIGGFAPGPFLLEARGHFLLDMDPGGDACALMTGFSSAMLTRYLRVPLRVTHLDCQSRKGDLCRWNVQLLTEPGED